MFAAIRNGATYFTRPVFHARESVQTQAPPVHDAQPRAANSTSNSPVDTLTHDPQQPRPATATPTYPDHQDYHSFVRSLQHVKVLVADLETTGKSPETNRIVQAGFVPVDAHTGILGGGYEQTINPQQPIPKFLNEGPNRIYDITDKDVRTKPTFEQIAPQLAEIMDGKTVVFYNKDFDKPFLEASFKRLGLSLEQLNVKVLCLMKIAKSLQPPAASFSLDSAARARGIDVSDRQNAHGALLDAKKTALLLPHLSREYAEAKQKYVISVNKQKLPFVLPEAELLFYPETAKTALTEIPHADNTFKPTPTAQQTPFARAAGAAGPSAVARSPWHQAPVSMTRDARSGEFRINFGKKGVFGQRHFGKTLSEADDSFFDFALKKMQPYRFEPDALIAIRAEAAKRDLRNGRPAARRPELEVSASSQTTSRVTRSSARNVTPRVPYERVTRAQTNRYSNGV